MTTVVAPTGETRVTTTTPQNEHNPTIAALRDGGWIVSWTLTTSDEQDAEIYQQRYNADGQAVDGAIMVNKHTAGQQLYSSVTALSDGGWIVAWKSTGPDGSGTKISHQRYAADGQKIGPERQIDGGQSIKVTTLNDGGWIITYHAGGVQGFDIYQQRYGADGYEQGGRTLVNTNVGGHQFDADVTALADGGWVVTWCSVNDTRVEIHQQRFNSSGAVVRDEARIVGSNTQGENEPSVSALKDGGWLVTWVGGSSLDGSIAVYQQRYHASGWTYGEAVQVAVVENSQQSQPSVAALPDGGWVVAWTEIAQDGSGDNVYQRRFAANGQAIDSKGVLVSTTVADRQLEPAVTVLSDGGWVVTWQSSNQDGSDRDIYQQRFTADGVKVGPTTPTGLALAAAAVAEGAAGTASAGTLSTNAFVADHAFTYRLVDDAGGRFRLEGNQIKVRDGIRLDYEQATSHTVTVEVKDAVGATLTKSFTIQVADVASERLAGSAGSDVLKGGRSKDTFNGGAGHDRLWGGLGNDVLAGGAGRDVFVFDTKPHSSTNRDKIADFSVRDDGIWLDNAVFTKLGAGSESRPVQLKSGFFVKGDKAKDANDHVLYDPSKGVLFYDADGSGRGKAVEIATLSKNLSLTYEDFLVI